MNTVQTLKDRHKDQTAYIVGKGPSIFNLKESHFAAGPIITLNHAIHYVEALNLENKVYSMQKDGCDINERKNSKCEYSCKVRARGPTGSGGYPKKAALLLSFPESWLCYPDYPKRYVFDVEVDLGFDRRMPQSLPNATRIAELMGVKKIELLCFDSIDGIGDSVEFGNIKPAAKRRTIGDAVLYDQSGCQIAQEAMSVPFNWVSIDA